MAIQKVLYIAADMIESLGTLLILVSASLPADYSVRLFENAMQLESQGLHVRLKMRGLDQRSKAWLARNIMQARKIYAEKTGDKAPDLDLDIDSTPFKALNADKVPVFIYKYKNRLYRVQGAYRLKDTIQALAKGTGEEKLKHLKMSIDQ